MKIRKRFILIALLCFTVGLGQLFAGGGGQRSAASRLSIAGGPTGGAYYALSLGIADLLMREMDGLTIDVVTTAGAVENPFLVGQRENDFGIATGEMVLAAANGTGVFAGNRQDDLRLMFSGVAGGSLHLITGPSINRIEDLRGRRIAVGPEGNITSLITFLILQQHGINAGDFIPSFLAFEDGMAALSDGQVDASVAVAAFPIPAVQELAANTNFNYRLLPISRNTIDAIIAEHPAYGIITIPRGTYNRQAEDVLTIGTTNFMLINSRVPDDQVYQMVKIIFENLDIVHRSHASARALTLEGAASEIIPLHEGARRFFRERGIIR